MKLPQDCWLFGKFPPEIVIIAGIHGNERANVKTLKAVMESDLVKKLKKSVIFIIGNAEALEQNKRFVENDLNREFNKFSDSIEGRRAKELAEVMNNTKFLLDMHLTQIPTLVPFVTTRATKENISFFKKMNVPVEEFVVTKNISPGSMSTDDYVLSKNPEAVTMFVELGSIFEDENKIVELGKKFIIEFLENSGALTSNKKTKEKSIVLWDEVQGVENRENVKLVPGIENFGVIKKEQIIAYENGNPIKSKFDGVALFPKYAPTKDRYLLRVITEQKA